MNGDEQGITLSGDEWSAALQRESCKIGISLLYCAVVKFVGKFEIGIYVVGAADELIRVITFSARYQVV